MKVRPSVKKMCDKCKIIRRHGKVLVIARTLVISSARAKERKIYHGSSFRRRPPLAKRIEIGLTYIYGIGNTTAKKIIARRR